MTLSLCKSGWATCFSVLAAGVGFNLVFANPAWSQQGGYVAYPRSLISERIGQPTNNPIDGLKRLPGLMPDYRLGVRDKVEVTIVGQGPIVREVTAAGEIAIPFVGNVAIADLTPEEAETKIAGELKARDLIKEPQVLVSVTSYQSKKVYVVGEVDVPGEYNMSFRYTLMDLIFLAGGLDFSSTRYGYLHRAKQGTAPTWRPLYNQAGFDEDLMKNPDVARPGSEVIRIDLQPLMEGGVLEQNILLRDGDLLYVPRREVEFVYILGEVGLPGAYEYPSLGRVTAVQAISWANGPTPQAKVSEGMLVREGADGDRTEMTIDFEAMLWGRQSDVEVRPGDLIFLPNSTAKTVGGDLVRIVPGIIQFPLYRLVR